MENILTHLSDFETGEQKFHQWDVLRLDQDTCVVFESTNDRHAYCLFNFKTRKFFVQTNYMIETYGYTKIRRASKIEIEWVLSQRWKN